VELALYAKGDLRPGDEVVGTGTHLGVLANRVDEFVTRAVR